MLTIRPATVDDLATVVSFNVALAWESEAYRLDPEVLTPGVRRVLTDPQCGFYTIAESEGEPLGQTMITHEWSDWRNGWFWWIQSVYVAPTARQAGVFTAIYRHLVQRAAADPTVIGLRLYVERQNDRAQATYRKLGMTDESYNVLRLYPLPGRQDHIQKGTK
ncbi:MAG: GNAT family N-acetyltransferase [Gemmataceae bacterium]